MRLPTIKSWLIFGAGFVSCIVCIIVLILCAYYASARYRVELGARNYMRQVVFSMCLMYPDDHDGYLPTNFLCMSNYSDTPAVLVFPGDHLHQPAASWASFTTNNCSFEIVSPGARAGGSNTVFLRCPAYGYVAYANAAIYDSSGHLLSPAPVIERQPNTY